MSRIELNTIGYLIPNQVQRGVITKINTRFRSDASDPLSLTMSILSGDDEWVDHVYSLELLSKRKPIKGVGGILVTRNLPGFITIVLREFGKASYLFYESEELDDFIELLEDREFDIVMQRDVNQCIEKCLERNL